MLQTIVDTLQAFLIFGIAVGFLFLFSPLWIFAAPALVAWYSVPAAPTLDEAAA